MIILFIKALIVDSDIMLITLQVNHTYNNTDITFQFLKELNSNQNLIRSLLL